MAEQTLKLPDDSANTGKQLRAQEVTVGAETVQQEVVTVAKSDGTLLAPLTDTELRASAVPVSGPLTDAQLRATAVPVSGTVTASGPLTDAQLRATAVPVSGTVTASGPLTDAQLRAAAVPMSAASLPLPTGAAAEATLAEILALLPSALVADRLKVDGSGVTQPVSGPLTDAQLRAAAVPVSGSVNVSGAVDVSDGGFSLTVDGTVNVVDGGASLTVDGPLTDAQLRATAVPVSGTVTASGPLTDAQLRATPVPVSGAVSVSGAATGGASSHSAVSAASTNATSVKASAGTLLGFYFFNQSSGIRYVKIYNKASAPTVGTDTPHRRYPIPPGGGAVMPTSPPGVAFSTGIAYAITAGTGLDADTTAVAAADVIINLDYV